MDELSTVCRSLSLCLRIILGTSVVLVTVAVLAASFLRLLLYLYSILTD